MSGRGGWGPEEKQIDQEPLKECLVLRRNQVVVLSCSATLGMGGGGGGEQRGPRSRCVHCHMF